MNQDGRLGGLAAWIAGKVRSMVAEATIAVEQKWAMASNTKVI